MKLISIGDKQYKVKVVKTDEEKHQGLRHVKNLAEDEGMLFVWENPQLVQMTMEDTEIPLDQVFINDDYEVIKIAHRDDLNDDTLIGRKDTLMVLEVNINSDIKVGDELEFDDEDSSDQLMHILAPDGSTQMKLEGGERIFSRKNTITLIKLAKRAAKTNAESDYRRLGRKVFKFLHIQDINTPEYVELKKK